MKVYGYTINDSIIKKVINSVDKNCITATILARLFLKNGVPRDDGRNYIAISAATRLIQQLRKEAKIKRVYGGGYNTIWKWINK